MKKILFIAILSVLGSIAFQSCKSKPDNEEIIQWISKAKKPIVCRRAEKSKGWGIQEQNYTLIDSCTNIYQTGWTNLNLPDTIK